jgi:hypothetical protein
MKRLLASCSILAALAAGPANAAVLLLDNSSPTLSGFGGYGMGTSEKTGVVFTTGSSAITINNLSVLLKGSSAAVNNASVTVDLFVGSPNTIGGSSSPLSSAAQATLTTNVNLLASAALTSVAAASSYATSINTGGGFPWTLAANQQYFLAVSTTTSDVTWVSSAGSTPSVSGGVTYNGWGGYFGTGGSALVFPNGNAAPWIIISDTASGGGGGSSVPDAGPGPALALLLGGLGFRQWRASRRTRAAA